MKTVARLHPTAAGIVLLSVLAFSLHETASSGEIYPLDRMLKLDVWNGNLEAVATEIRKQTGVELVYFRPDFPPEKENIPLYIVTGNVSLRLVMECLSRRYGCRYRLSETGRLELSLGYDWVGSGFAVRFNELDGLLPETGDTASPRNNLRNILRVLPLLSDDFSFNIEVAPASGGRHSAKGVAILPPILADYFDRAIRCLKGEAGDAHPTGIADPFAPRAVVVERAPWSQLLAAEFEIPTGISDPRTLMQEISSKVNVAIMLGENPGAGTVRSGLLSGRTGLGRATEELAGILGLSRRVLLNPGAVILIPGKPGEWEEDSGTREFFWSGLAVAGFDTKHLATPNTIDALVSRIKNTIFPAVWLDPACSFAYNPVTSRIALVAPGNVVAAVATELSEPLRR